MHRPTRIKSPGKWFPRRFDIFGASHQIVHVMVIVARLVHTFGVLWAFHFHIRIKIQ